jgi:hypothetical protein
MIFGDTYSDEMAKVTITAFLEEGLKEGLKALADKERRYYVSNGGFTG